MKSLFWYDQGEKPAPRPARSYARWLRFWARALVIPPRGNRVVWAEDAAAETLLRGFPSLLAVPAPLFAPTAALFPDRLRLAAEGKDEKTLLAAVRAIGQACGARFDWDRFFAACERQNRRARRLRALSRALETLAPAELDLSSARAALASLGERKTQT